MLTLLIHEVGHSVLYFLLAIIAFHLLKKRVFPWFEVIFGYIVTIGIDVDHLFDYLRYTKLIKFNIRDFLVGNYFSENGKIFVLFHAWEWFAIVLFFYFLTKKKYSILVFVAVAIAAQLIFDTFSYGFDPRVYFITYRALHNFTDQIFFPVLY